LGRRSNRGKARDNRHSQGGEIVQRDETDLPALIEASDSPFLLILDGVQDPHNLGAILRTADAVGIDAVIVPRKRAVGITETVARISCGASESVPFIRVTNIARTIVDFQDRGICIVGTADGARATSLYAADLTQPFALVMGAEGRGLRRLTHDLCDLVVSLPMLGKVECLNVSVATGICLYEAIRQRLASPKKA